MGLLLAERLVTVVIGGSSVGTITGFVAVWLVGGLVCALMAVLTAVGAEALVLAVTLLGAVVRLPQPTSAVAQILMTANTVNFLSIINGTSIHFT